jgi:hypothetical protein
MKMKGSDTKGVTPISSNTRATLGNMKPCPGDRDGAVFKTSDFYFITETVGSSRKFHKYYMLK